MKISASEKHATRERIVEQAADLFRSRGFEATTTRDIAKAAGIATGTLFNYFDNKEAIVGELAQESLAKARAAFDEGRSEESLQEELFALVAAELRQLKPLRKFISPLLETELSPLAQRNRHTPSAARGNCSDQVLRVAHLELVIEIARRHGVQDISPVALQVYWALYTGVLAFWAADKSPKQEDTLALLDQSLHMFVASLQAAEDEPRK